LEIPLKIRVAKELRSIRGFRIVRFQDNGLTNPRPHDYVLAVIPNESNFLVIIITSKIDERCGYYRRTHKPEAANCLIRINKDNFSFLRLPSAINCNETKHMNLADIIHMIDETAGFRIRDDPVPTYLRREIVSGILQSPMISPFIRKKAILTNPL